MKRKIFLNVFAITMLAFVACQTITLAVLYRYVSGQRKAELRSEAGYYSKAVEAFGGEIIEELFFEEKGDNVIRLTLVDADGTVLYDSGADAETLENHGSREEIREAFAKGTGESTRTSDTLQRHTYNYAVLLESGQVLRISGTQYTMVSLLMNMLSPMVIVLTAVVVLSVILAVRISNSITEPINSIDLESPDARSIYPELRPLAERINEQNRQLHQHVMELKEEHERQDRYRREFTANVSHELKTPLTSISGYAEILGAGLVQEQDVGRFADKIYEESKRLIALVGDIIRLSQLEDGAVPMEREQVDLLAVCEKTAERLAAAAEQKHIRFRVGGSKECVWGIPQILEEMVYNLCDNAIKYNVEGGSVRVTVTSLPDAVSLSVQDTGIGIPHSEQERVFERFYRVDKSHSKEVGGTGLGLSIVKHGASCHGAVISLKSEPGEGTEIRVIFPKNPEKLTELEKKEEI